MTDECMKRKLRISYASFLVEVDVKKDLTKEIAINDCEGRKLVQKVEYEWKPPFCNKYQHIGHQCKVAESKQWNPKAKPPETTKVVTSATEVSTVIKPVQVDEANEGELTQVTTTRD